MWLGEGRRVVLSCVLLATDQLAASYPELLSPRTSHFLAERLLWENKSCVPASLILKHGLSHLFQTLIVTIVPLKYVFFKGKKKTPEFD